MTTQITPAAERGSGAAHRPEQHPTPDRVPPSGPVGVADEPPGAVTRPPGAASPLLALDCWIAQNHRRWARLSRSRYYPTGGPQAVVELYDGGALTGRSDLPIVTCHSSEGSDAAVADALRTYQRLVDEAEAENEQLDAHWAAQERKATLSAGPLNSDRDNREPDDGRAPCAEIQTYRARARRAS